MQLKIYQVEGPKYLKNIFGNTSEITHIVGKASYSDIYFIDGSIIKISYNLGRIEMISDTFRRVHKSFIVNSGFIKKISENKDRIYLQNGVVIPVRYFEELKNNNISALN